MIAVSQHLFSVHFIVFTGSLGVFPVQHCPFGCLTPADDLGERACEHGRWEPCYDSPEPSMEFILNSPGNWTYM